MSQQNIPKVLYLDDEEVNLVLFKLTFIDEIDILTAIDGVEALKILNDTPDLKAVITDMRMPKMSGMDFIKQARSINSDIPYFILSGFDVNDEVQEAIDQKVIHDFIQKPFEKSYIISTLSPYF